MVALSEKRAKRDSVAGGSSLPERFQTSGNDFHIGGTIFAFARQHRREQLNSAFRNAAAAQALNQQISLHLCLREHCLKLTAHGIDNFAGEHFKSQTSKRINIGASIRLLPTTLLGTHIAHTAERFTSAHLSPRCRSIGADSIHAKVRNNDF
ncbi:MAG: hypothetical protein BWY75_03621 [bacterium ADurb.Bin425]|nr:MAG: hypothetical protein BWY75_03621 [bacterium ADurb.Bin425]